MIIFDLDGTLWETIDATYEAANIIVDKHSDLKNISKETIIKGMGLGTEENEKNYMPYIELEQGIEYMKEISDKTSEIINEENVKIYKGVSDTIKELSKKYKLAIITNNRDRYAETFLKISNLNSYFTDYMGAASYNISKGEAIKNMVKKHGEKENYYVGDIKKDQEATMYAGITFIHAKYGFEPTLQSKLTIKNIKELPNLLEKESNK